MQIEHIRIGNIFWLVKNERYSDIVAINAKCEKPYVELNDYGTIHRVDFDSLIPIELDDELFVKFGHKVDNTIGGKIWCSSARDFIVPNEEYDGYTINGFDIKYLHEYQNYLLLKNIREIEELSELMRKAML